MNTYKPKELVWKKISDKNDPLVIRAYTLFGTYTILEANTGWFFDHIAFDSTKHNLSLQEQKSLESAKKAAQNHYNEIWISGGEEVLDEIIYYEESSGGVFKDLGLENEEELKKKVQELIEKQKNK